MTGERRGSGIPWAGFAFPTGILGGLSEAAETSSPVSYRGVKPEAMEKPFLGNLAKKSTGLSLQKGPLVHWFISGQTVPNPVSLSAGTAQCPGGLGLLDLPPGKGGLWSLPLEVTAPSS